MLITTAILSQPIYSPACYGARSYSNAREKNPILRCRMFGINLKCMVEWSQELYVNPISQVNAAGKIIN